MTPKRFPRIVGEVAFVPLTKGYEAMVDVQDLPLLGPYAWAAWFSRSNNIYAARKHVHDGIRSTVRMHHLILPRSEGLEVDHIDGNGLNNRRANLRLVTRSENQRNKRPRRDGKLPGIYLDKRRGIYTASITLGSFQTLEEAMTAQKDAITKLETISGRPLAALDRQDPGPSA